MTSPFKPQPVLADEPDVRYVVNLGLKGPTYSKPTDNPLTKGQWYMDLDGRSVRPWVVPDTPLLHTKGTCGVADIPLINVPKEANRRGRHQQPLPHRARSPHARKLLQSHQQPLPHRARS